MSVSSATCVVLTQDLHRGGAADGGGGDSPRGGLLAVSEEVGLGAVASNAGIALYDVGSAESTGRALLRSGYLCSIALRDSAGAPLLPAAVAFCARGDSALPSLAVVGEASPGSDELLFFDLFRAAGVSRSVRGGGTELGGRSVRAVLSARVVLKGVEERGSVARSVAQDVREGGGLDGEGEVKEAVEDMETGSLHPLTSRGDFFNISPHPTNPNMVLVANSSTAKAFVCVRKQTSFPRSISVHALEVPSSSWAVTTCGWDRSGRFAALGDVGGRGWVFATAYHESRDQFRGVLVRGVVQGCGVTALTLVTIPRHPDASEWSGYESKYHLPYDFALSHLVLVLGHAGGQVSMWWLAPRRSSPLLPPPPPTSTPPSPCPLLLIPSASYPCLHASRGWVVGLSWTVGEEGRVRGGGRGGGGGVGGVVEVVMCAQGLRGLRRFPLSILTSPHPTFPPPKHPDFPHISTSIVKYDDSGRKSVSPAPPPPLPHLTQPHVAFPSFERIIATPLIANKSQLDDETDRGSGDTESDHRSPLSSYTPIHPTSTSTLSSVSSPNPLGLHTLSTPLLSPPPSTTHLTSLLQSSLAEEVGEDDKDASSPPPPPILSFLLLTDRGLHLIGSRFLKRVATRDIPTTTAYLKTLHISEPEEEIEDACSPEERGKEEKGGEEEEAGGGGEGEGVGEREVVGGGVVDGSRVVSIAKRFALPRALSETPLPTLAPRGEKKRRKGELGRSVDELGGRVDVLAQRVQRMKKQTKDLRTSVRLFSDQVSTSLAILAQRIDESIAFKAAHTTTTTPTVPDSADRATTRLGVAHSALQSDFWAQEE